MKYVLTLLILFSITPLFAQEITSMDFVQTVDGNREELIYYYENNWKVLREMALERGVIQSYEFLSTHEDSTLNFDIILITRYKNKEDFDLSEERFEVIIDEVMGERGLMLLNDKERGEFRSLVFYTSAETIFSSPKD